MKDVDEKYKSLLPQYLGQDYEQLSPRAALGMMLDQLPLDHLQREAALEGALQLSPEEAREITLDLIDAFEGLRPVLDDLEKLLAEHERKK